MFYFRYQMAQAEACGGEMSGGMNTPVRLNKKLRASMEVIRAVDGINYICEHMRKEDEEKIVKEQWKYVALVIDRLFLWIFTSACAIGTCAIILQAPSFYDNIPPIDKQLSTRFT